MLEQDGSDSNPVNEIELTPASKGMILLAEDNPVNQKIGLMQLHKLGYTAQGVNDGLEVLETLSHRQTENYYSLILMDCQMPHMDGFEATRAIRQQEKARGNNHHIPIIALTANTLQGDREVCLATGMDDYLTKPIVLEELEQRLDYWIKQTGIPGVTAGPDPEPMGTSPLLAQAAEFRSEEAKESDRNTNTIEDDLLDQKVLDNLKKLQELSGAALLNPLIDLFLTDTPERLARIAKAISEQDGRTLERIAHSLKGSCGNLGLKRMAPLCRALEEAGKAGKTAETGPILEQLDSEYKQVASLLQAIKTEETNPAEA